MCTLGLSWPVKVGLCKLTVLRHIPSHSTEVGDLHLVPLHPEIIDGTY